MDNKVIILNSVSLFHYKFILNISILKSSATSFSYKDLKKEQHTQDDVSIYYKHIKNNKELLFYTYQPFVSSNSFLYSLCTINNITLDKILHDIYYKKNIPTFPIILSEKPIF